MVGHLYYLSVGEGSLVGYLIECISCKMQMLADPFSFSALKQTPPQDLGKLIQETSPTLLQAREDRLTLETQLEQSPASIPAEVRQQLLLEPFHALNYLAEQRLANSSLFDRPAAIGCLGTVALAIGAITLGIVESKAVSKAAFPMLLFVMVAGSAYTYLQLHLGSGRYMRDHLAPLVAYALQPLHPSHAELQECLKRRQSDGCALESCSRLNTCGLN